MIFETKQEMLPGVRIVVGADSLEDRARVGNGQRQWMDPGIGKRHELTVHEHDALLPAHYGIESRT